MTPRVRPWSRGVRLGSFRRQLVALSAAVTALAVVLLTLLLQLVLAQSATRSVSRVLDDRIDAVVSSTQSVSTGDGLVVPDSRLDAGVAVYDDAGTLVAGSAPSSVAELYAELSTATSTRTLTPGGEAAIRARPFTLTSGARGVVVVTERLAPYEQAERYALVVSLATGVLAVLASAGLAAWISRRALAPVLEMAARADDWSEHDLGRRFDLGAPTNELTALAGTLDTLLDRVSAAIRSEQRLTSELAHELRTPLTAVQGTADLVALRPGLDPEVAEDVEEIRAGARRMAETISGLLELARSTSGPGVPGRPGVPGVSGAGSGAGSGGASGADGAPSGDRAVADLTVALAEVVADLGPGGRVSVEVPAGLHLALPTPLAVRAIAPVVENAVRVAEHVVIRVVDARPGFVGVAVDDDGPGVDEPSRELIFEPGHTVGNRSGSGLGLPLARRIARSAGGDVRLVPRVPGVGGTRFVVELPRA